MTVNAISLEEGKAERKKKIQDSIHSFACNNTLQREFQRKLLLILVEMFCFHCSQTKHKHINLRKVLFIKRCVCVPMYLFERKAPVCKVGIHLKSSISENSHSNVNALQWFLFPGCLVRLAAHIDNEGECVNTPTLKSDSEAKCFFQGQVESLRLDSRFHQAKALILVALLFPCEEKVALSFFSVSLILSTFYP